MMMEIVLTVMLASIASVAAICLVMLIVDIWRDENKMLHR